MPLSAGALWWQPISDLVGGQTIMRVGTYKGHNYKLLFIGETKYGRRAHLAFIDGSKDFWVNAGDVTITDQRVCVDCGRVIPLWSREDRCRECHGEWCDDVDEPY
jgi:hypothetical protein